MNSVLISVSLVDIDIPIIFLHRFHMNLTLILKAPSMKTVLYSVPDRYDILSLLCYEYYCEQKFFVVMDITSIEWNGLQDHPHIKCLLFCKDIEVDSIFACGRREVRMKSISVLLCTMMARTYNFHPCVCVCVHVHTWMCPCVKFLLQNT